MFGCGRSQLHVRLLERDRAPCRRPGGRHGVLGVDDIRRHGARHHPLVLGLRQRRQRQLPHHAPHLFDDGRRRRVRWGRTRVRARAPWTPTTRSVTCNGSVQVDPAPLSVAASSASGTYGGAGPTITPSYSGFVNGDSAGSLTTPPTCSTSATASSPVGSYPSSCTGAVDPNYTISYVGGEVVVGTAVLVVSASSDTMTYGGALPTVTPSYSGFVNGDTRRR